MIFIKCNGKKSKKKRIMQKAFVNIKTSTGFSTGGATREDVAQTLIRQK